jgi:hypothetical protein
MFSQWRTGKVASLPDGKWAPLDIRKYEPGAMCVCERKIERERVRKRGGLKYSTGPCYIYISIQQAFVGIMV